MQVARVYIETSLRAKMSSNWYREANWSVSENYVPLCHGAGVVALMRVMTVESDKHAMCVDVSVNKMLGLCNV